MKKRIALIVDVEDWAFGNIAKMIEKHLSKYYDFKIFPIAYLNDNMATLYLLTKDYDLIHFFWRGHISYTDGAFFKEYVEQLGTSYDYFMKRFVDSKLRTTCVYDHLFLEEEFNITESVFSKVRNYYVSSSRLYKIYNNLDIENKPMMIITDGVELDKFYPKNLSRFNNISERVIKIGWVGNSAWNGKDKDFKGVNTILRPAISKLKKEGYKIEEFFADRQQKMIPHCEMCDYYSKVDILVCASLVEGTPNPVLEALACGVPIISTDVGIVPDALGEKGKKFILNERSVECMYENIKKLINDADMFLELSDENIKQAKKWSWENKMLDFKMFFDTALVSNRKRKENINDKKVKNTSKHHKK